MLSADNQQERLKENTLHPWYISGFVEGEGSFHVALYKDPHMRTGIKVIPEFHINQSYLRLITLLMIQKFFKCGYIKENHRSNKKDVTRVYVIRNRKDLLEKIVPFFMKYPLLSEKQNSFLKFKQILEMIQNGEHRKKFGMRKIISLAYTMNNNGIYRQNDKKVFFTLLESSETIRQTPEIFREKI